MDNTVASNFLFDVKNFYMTNFFQEGNSENLTEKTEKSSRDMERSEYK